MAPTPPKTNRPRLARNIIHVVEGWRQWWPLTPGQVRHGLIHSGAIDASPAMADEVVDIIAVALMMRDVPSCAITPFGALTPPTKGFVHFPTKEMGVHCMGAMTATMRMDRQRGQVRRAVVVSTNRPLAASVEPLCARYSVQVLSPLFPEASPGDKRWTAPAIGDALVLGLDPHPVTALVLDDYDIQADGPLLAHWFFELQAIVAKLGGDLRVRHVALTIDQVEKIGPLPPISVANFGGGNLRSVVSPEALCPETLQSILAEEIEAELDMAKVRTVDEYERQVHAELMGKPDADVTVAADSPDMG